MIKDKETKYMRGNISIKVIFICFVLIWLFPGFSFAFDDLSAQENEWIQPLVERGIINGMDDGLFHGTEKITRAQVAAILVRTNNLEHRAAGSDMPFVDVGNHWAAESIQILWEYGYVNGRGDGIFDPDGLVSYTEWLKLFLCTEGYQEEADEMGGYPEGYKTIASYFDWYEYEVYQPDRMMIAKMLSDYVTEPFKFRRVMTVRSENPVTYDSGIKNVRSIRLRLFDDEGTLLTAQRIDAVNESEIQEVLNNNIQLNTLGTGTYMLAIEGLDSSENIIVSTEANLHVLPRDQDNSTNYPLLEMDVLKLSQGYGGEGGHKGTYAIDLIGRDDGVDTLHAPFDGIITKIYQDNGEQNFVWLESIEPQQLPDGRTGYVTVMTGHDNYIGDLYVGKEIKRGEAYYHEGSSGIARGNHIPLEVGFSKTTDEGWILNEYGRWEISNSIPPEEVFLLDDSVTWIRTQESEGIEFSFKE